MQFDQIMLSDPAPRSVGRIEARNPVMIAIHQYPVIGNIIEKTVLAVTLGME